MIQSHVLMTIIGRLSSLRNLTLVQLIEGMRKKKKEKPFFRNMRTKVFSGFGLILMLVIFCCSTKINSSKPSYIPKDGFVPNQETAIKIAEAIWLPVYGDK